MTASDGPDPAAVFIPVLIHKAIAHIYGPTDVETGDESSRRPVVAAPHINIRMQDPHCRIMHIIINVAV